MDCEGDSDDYEHWPDDFKRSSPAKSVVFLPAESEYTVKRLVTEEPAALITEGPRLYTYKAAKPVEVISEEPGRHTYRSSTRKETPARVTEHSHVQADSIRIKTARKDKYPSQIHWIGRTKAEVAEDNATIGAKVYADAPEGPKDLKDDSLVWVQDANGSLFCMDYSKVKNMDGNWKKYSNSDNWYFKRA